MNQLLRKPERPDLCPAESTQPVEGLAEEPVYETEADLENSLYQCGIKAWNTFSENAPRNKSLSKYSKMWEIIKLLDSIDFQWFGTLPDALDAQNTPDAFEPSPTGFERARSLKIRFGDPGPENRV